MSVLSAALAALTMFFLAPLVLIASALVGAFFMFVFGGLLFGGLFG